MIVNCVICSDFLNETDDISSAPCGHIFHLSCLTRWIVASETCPQCRARTTITNIRKLFFNFLPVSDFNSVLDSEREIIYLKVQMIAKDSEVQAYRKQEEETKALVRWAEERANVWQEAMRQKEKEIDQLKLQLRAKDEKLTASRKLEEDTKALVRRAEERANLFIGEMRVKVKEIAKLKAQIIANDEALTASRKVEEETVRWAEERTNAWQEAMLQKEKEIVQLKTQLHAKDKQLKACIKLEEAKSFILQEEEILKDIKKRCGKRKKKELTLSARQKKQRIFYENSLNCQLLLK